MLQRLGVVGLSPILSTCSQPGLCISLTYNIISLVLGNNISLQRTLTRRSASKVRVLLNFDQAPDGEDGFGRARFAGHGVLSSGSKVHYAIRHHRTAPDTRSVPFARLRASFSVHNYCDRSSSSLVRSHTHNTATADRQRPSPSTLIKSKGVTWPIGDERPLLSLRQTTPLPLKWRQFYIPMLQI